MGHFYLVVPDELRRLSIGTVIDRFEAGGDEPARVIDGLGREQLNAHPVPGTWSIQQIICHLMDTDQIAAYRMKRIIAEERPTWDLYDENAFAGNLDYERRDPVVTCEAFRLNRRLMAAMLRGLSRSSFDRVGMHREVGMLNLDTFVRLYTHHLEHHMRFARQKREMVVEADTASPAAHAASDARPVLGLGGVFFKSSDPARLRAWYCAHLGIEADGDGCVRFRFSDECEPSRPACLVWSPFPDDTQYFEPSDKPFMLNFRVRDLDALLVRLRNVGVTVDDRVESYEYGRFGWIMDPEGNRIELWEPADGA